MAVRKINIIKTHDYTWEFDGNSSNDKPKSTLKYKDDYEDWISRCPLYGDAHPDLDGFVLVAIKAAREVGDIIAVTLYYEAASWVHDFPGRPAGETATVRYSLQVSGREEHILTSEYSDDPELTETERKALLAISNGSEADEAGVKWDTLIESVTGLTLLEKIRRGNTAYKTGGIIYIERKTVTSLDSLRRTRLYKRDLPPGPAFGAEANWLYLGGNLTPSTDGATWEAEFQWEYSPDEWDEDLYAFRAPPA